MRTFHHHVEKEKYLLVILQSIEKIEDCILTITILPPLEIPIQSNTFRSVLHLILAENKGFKGRFTELIFYILNPYIRDIVENLFCHEYFVNKFLQKEF